MSKSGQVQRPLKRTEYRVEFHTREARAGWIDLLPTARNATIDAWDRLTKDPGTSTQRQYPLRGDLAALTWGGRTHERWQYKVTDGARILVLRR